MDVEFFYSEHDYQWIVMGLSNATTVSFLKDDIKFVIPWHLHWRES